MNSATAWSDQLTEQRQVLTNTEPVLRAIAEKVIFPAFARNYDASGLKPGRGVLKAALTKAGSRGNILEIRGNRLTVGVSYQILPSARYAIEGRGRVVAKRAGALRWYDDNGKPIFRKSVGPAPPHDVVYLTGADMDKAQEVANEMLGVGWTVSRP